MKTPTLLLSLSLSLVAGGCIDTKDVGVESDSSSGGASSGASSDTPPSGATAGASTSGAASDTVTASGTTTTAAGSESGGETETGVTTSVEGTESSSGTESSTGSDTQGDEEALCEASGGGWDLETCGHYVCGLPQDCQAVIPGCDCGEHRVFVEGLGCQVGAECDPYEFDCGEELCLAPAHYCDVTLPGPKGPTIYECVDMPAACDGNYSCACLDAEGLIAPGECDEEFKVGAITVTTAKP